MFKISPDGTETVLHSFAGGLNDGAMPGSLIMDNAGSLYGATRFGGSTWCVKKGCGIIFRISPDGSFKILHAFNGDDGWMPGVAKIDLRGNLFGLVRESALSKKCGAVCGGMLVDSKGNLFGTTESGGLFDDDWK